MKKLKHLLDSYGKRIANERRMTCETKLILTHLNFSDFRLVK